jgi:hypothetical protein
MSMFTSMVPVPLTASWSAGTADSTFCVRRAMRSPFTRSIAQGDGQPGQGRPGSHGTRQAAAGRGVERPGLTDRQRALGIALTRPYAPLSSCRTEAECASASFGELTLPSFAGAIEHRDQLLADGSIALAFRVSAVAPFISCVISSFSIVISASICPLVVERLVHLREGKRARGLHVDLARPARPVAEIDRSCVVVTWIVRPALATGLTETGVWACRDAAGDEQAGHEGSRCPYHVVALPDRVNRRLGRAVGRFEFDRRATRRFV